MIRRRLLPAVVLLAVLLGGCSETPIGSGPGAVRPRDGRSGLQLSGMISGRLVAISDGLPRLEATDCDPGDGSDNDVCVVSRTLDGTLFVLVFENPEILTPGTFGVGAASCSRPDTCDHVTDVAIIDLQLGVGERIRASAGELTLETVEPARRYRGTLRLDLPDGQLTGDFDVIPRPEPEE